MLRKFLRVHELWGQPWIFNWKKVNAFCFHSIFERWEVNILLLLDFIFPSHMCCGNAYLFTIWITNFSSLWGFWRIICWKCKRLNGWSRLYVRNSRREARKVTFFDFEIHSKYFWGVHSHQIGGHNLRATPIREEALCQVVAQIKAVLMSIGTVIVAERRSSMVTMRTRLMKLLHI